MENQRAGFILVACVVLGMLLIGQSTASFKDCYEACFLLCLLTPDHSKISCPFKCLKDCTFPPNSNSMNVFREGESHYDCKLGCALSSCTNISTEQDPAAEKVANCVDSCSSRCTKKNTP